MLRSLGAAHVLNSSEDGFDESLKRTCADLGVTFAIEAVAESVHLSVELVIHLQSEPELRRHLEVTGKAESRVRRESALTQHDLVDAPRRHTDVTREPILAEAHRAEELLEQNLPRMDRI